GLEQVLDRRAHEAVGRGERDRRIIGRDGDADLRVGGGGGAFGGGDVGPPLQQRRGYARRNHRDAEVERGRLDREVCGRPTDQDGDGVLELRALNADVDQLCPDALDLRSRLRHVRFRRG